MQKAARVSGSSFMFALVSAAALTMLSACGSRPTCGSGYMFRGLPRGYRWHPANVLVPAKGWIGADAVFQRRLSNDSVGFTVDSGSVGYRVVWQGNGAIVGYERRGSRLSVISVGVGQPTDLAAHVLSLRVAPRKEENRIDLFVDGKLHLAFKNSDIPIAGRKVIVDLVSTQAKDAARGADIRIGS